LQQLMCMRWLIYGNDRACLDNVSELHKTTADARM
jgi:hypothetical protein